MASEEEFALRFSRMNSAPAAYFGLPYAPGKRDSELPTCAIFGNEELHPYQLLRRLTEESGEEEAPRLVGLYAQARLQVLRATQPGANLTIDSAAEGLKGKLGIGTPDEIMLLLRAMELLSVVVTAMLWWIGKAQVDQTVRLLAETTIDALRFKRQALSCAEGRRLVNYARDTFGIVAF
jgi:hypothetical protein